MEQANFFGNIQKQIIINDSVINTLSLSNSEDLYPKILSSFKTHIDFQERGEELTELRRQLKENNHILVVNGIGGLGKSTIANALSLYDINEYKYLVWINISQGLKKSISSNKHLVENLKLTDRVNKIKLFYDAEQQQIEIFNIIISAISNIKEKSLLVFDDANVNFESEFLNLGLPNNWKIIITSRIHFDTLQTYELPTLTKEKAINLFYYYSKIKVTYENTKTIKRIVSYIWFHTLSIELLGKTIKNSFDLSLSKLENLLLESGLKEIPEFEIKTAYVAEKVREKIVVTSALKCLRIAFDLGDFRRNKLAIKILKYFALLPSIPLSYNTLLEIIDFEPSENIEFQNQLRNLVNTSWIVETIEGLYMHPIIQESIRNTLQLNSENSLDFIANLKKVIDSYQNAEKNDLSLYVAFSKNLIKAFSTTKNSTQYLNFILSFFKLLNTIGYPKDVLQIIEGINLESISENIHLEIYFEKAKALIILAAIEEAIEILNYIEKRCKAKSLLHGELQYHFGIIYKKQYDKTKNNDSLLRALENTEMSLEIFNNLAEVDTHISSSVFQKAQLLRRQGATELSLEHYERAKSIRIKKYGENHFKTALVFLDLGVLYNEKKDHKNGIENTKKAIDVLANYYGEDSLELAVPYHNYAHCFYVNEEFDKALEFELKCFEILKNNVEPSDVRYQKAEKKLKIIKEKMNY